MKWTKFKNTKTKDELPLNLWITDFVHVFPINRSQINIREYIEENPDDAWAEIIFPEVPKKELHHCQSGLLHHYSCKELNGQLVLIDHQNHPEKCFLSVNFCPFCGYSIKEKE